MSNKVKSLIIYGDFFFLIKKNALKDNIGKSGIYKLVHKISKKSYVGSYKDLNRRFKEYYNIKLLKRRVEKGNSRIYKALLNDGYDSFNLEILEYCDKNSLLKVEQDYIDRLKPE